MRTYFFPRNSLRLISFPVVLGSVKSGALSPTSTAVATPAPASTLTSSTPDRNRLFIRFATIFPLLYFHRTISFLPYNTGSPIFRLCSSLGSDSVSLHGLSLGPTYYVILRPKAEESLFR